MAKEYEIPEETKDIFDTYTSALECRDECIRSVFKANRAIKYGKKAEKARIEFWRQVSALHPTLKKPLEYNIEKGVITVAKDADKQAE